MKCRGEEGTALPAVLALLAILLIMGLEAAASALSVRLGIARGATAQQARAAAEAGLLLAGELPSGRLENLLESQTPVKLKSSYWPVGLDVSLEVHDDEEIDQRDGIHGNGRVFFLTRASQPFSPGSGMVVRSFVEEALVGAWTPQPGAVLDCVSGLAFCDGLGECRPPASHLSFQKGAALAVPEDRWIALKARWRIHLREMLRRASEACGEAGGTCRPALRDLWLAAATDMLRQFD
ncbi:MAG: hypothetical protein ACE5ID_11060, partial [Acidobacteriota bacterium]